MVALGPWIDPMLAVAAVSTAAFVLFRWYGGWVRGDRAAYRLRRTFAVGLPLVGLVTFGSLAAAGLFESVDAAVASVGIRLEPAGTAIGLSLAAVGVLVSVTAGYAGGVPAAIRIRDLDATPSQALRRFVRWTGSVLGVLVIVVIALGRLPVATWPGLSATVIGLVVLAYTGSPWLVRLGTPTRRPTPSERERLVRCCETVGIAPREITILETGGNSWPAPVIRGVPGRRTLFVTDYLLSAYADEYARVVLAGCAQRSRRFYTEYRLSVVLGVVLVGSWITMTGRSMVLLGVLAGGAVGLLWYGSRLVYRADEAVANDRGREVTLETYERLVADATAGSGRIQGFLRMRPPMRVRIARLERDRAARD